MEYAPSKIASTNAPLTVTVQYQWAQMPRNSQNLQASVSFGAEVIVKENKLLVFWIPIASLGCSHKGHCYRGRETNRERKGIP